MTTSFNFQTSEIKVTGSLGKKFGSQLEIKGTITRISNTKVKITAKVRAKYRMYINNMYFHFAYGTKEKDFTGNYPNITNGYTELSYSPIKKKIWVDNGKGWATTICEDKVFTVPDKELYFAVWFTAPSYYHIIVNQQDTNVIGGQTISKKLSRLYVAPSNLKLSVNDVGPDYINVSADWTEGSNTTKEQAKITVNGTTQTVSKSQRGNNKTFSGLIGNTSYTISGVLYDDTSQKDTASKSAITDLQTPYEIKTSSTTNSITVLARSNNSAGNNTTGNTLKYQYRYKKSSDTTWSSWVTDAYGVARTFTGLTTNTKYNIQAQAYRVKPSPTTSSTISIDYWTRPKAKLVLELVEGSEHNSIKATASADGSSSYAKYIFRLDSQAFNSADYNKTIVNPKIYTGLAGHSTHTVGVKMKNTQSGLESDEVTETITTWYNPISNLSVILDNKWYWYLAIKTGFLYDGLKDKIKYEFAIFNDSDSAYINKENTNYYFKGTIDPTKRDLEGLKYNTSYNCRARLTDEYGRTYTASAIFKTLDERSVYINNSSNEFELCEVKLIRQDGTNNLTHVTPNLLNVMNILNGTEVRVNMNKVINNDSREEFK